MEFRHRKYLRISNTTVYTLECICMATASCAFAPPRTNGQTRLIWSVASHIIRPVLAFIHLSIMCWPQNDMRMHLSNYSQNKTAENFAFNTSAKADGDGRMAKGWV